MRRQGDKEEEENSRRLKKSSPEAMIKEKVLNLCHLGVGMLCPPKTGKSGGRIFAKVHFEGIGV